MASEKRSNKDNTPKGEKKHPFARKLLINIGLMIVATFIIGWATLIWLDVFTEHGDEVATPSVKGLPYDVAEATLKSQGFSCEVMDSVYDTTRPPGTVTDQNPKEGSMVKEGREVYLTITAFSPRMVSLPKVTDVSERQARAMLAGIGIKNITTVNVPSEFRDLVVGMRVNGSNAPAGMRVPITTRVTLEVGSGYASLLSDSTAVDDSQSTDF